jgi:hypothetical protein
MTTTKHAILLKPRTLSEFAGVRGRVKAVVAAQPQSVSLSDAMKQVRKTHKVTGTK